MKEDNKRWLLSMMKTSGSKRRYVNNGSFSEERNTKKYQSQDFENLPNRESIGSTWKIYNGKLNYGLLVRFLNGQIGNDWDKVYSEIISRIPSKLLDYKEIIFWFVADKVEIKNELPYNKETNKFIWTPEQGEYNFNFDNKDFYVDPNTNQLLKIKDKPSRRKTKGLEKEELRKFREEEKNEKVLEKQFKKEKNLEKIQVAEDKLSNANKEKAAANKQFGEMRG